MGAAFWSESVLHAFPGADGDWPGDEWVADFHDEWCTTILSRWVQIQETIAVLESEGLAEVDELDDKLETGQWRPGNDRAQGLGCLTELEIQTP